MNRDRLTNEEINLLNSELDRRGKNVVIAYVLAFFFGTFGAHRLYMGKSISGIVMLLITVLSFGIGAIITAPWSLIDMLFISKWKEQADEKIEGGIVSEIINRRK